MREASLHPDFVEGGKRYLGLQEAHIINKGILFKNAARDALGKKTGMRRELESAVQSGDFAQWRTQDPKPVLLARFSSGEGAKRQVGGAIVRKHAVERDFHSALKEKFSHFRFKERSDGSLSVVFTNQPKRFRLFGRDFGPENLKVKR